MDRDTRRLLEECDSGCKMAINSMNQVLNDVTSDKFKQLIDGYRVKHEKIEAEVADHLTEAGQDEKEPPVMASVFSWISTEMKLMIKEGDREIAKVMMDGCNMGIQSVCKYQNEFTEAGEEAKKLAHKIVQVEEDFMKELEEYV